MIELNCLNELYWLEQVLCQGRSEVSEIAIKKKKQEKNLGFKKIKIIQVKKLNEFQKSTWLFFISLKNGEAIRKEKYSSGKKIDKACTETFKIEIKLSMAVLFFIEKLKTKFINVLN